VAGQWEGQNVFVCWKQNGTGPYAQLIVCILALRYWRATLIAYLVVHNSPTQLIIFHRLIRINSQSMFVVTCNTLTHMSPYFCFDFLYWTGKDPLVSKFIFIADKYMLLNFIQYLFKKQKIFNLTFWLIWVMTFMCLVYITTRKNVICY
jgi:hypothetical protein